MLGLSEVKETFFFYSNRRRHTILQGDWSSDVCSSDLPRLAEMQLVDYKVRVVNSKAGTAARVRVVIESRDPSDVWGTVGVSENIIEASWLALVDSKIGRASCRERV